MRIRRLRIAEHMEKKKEQSTSDQGNETSKIVDSILDPILNLPIEEDLIQTKGTEAYEKIDEIEKLLISGDKNETSQKVDKILDPILDLDIKEESTTNDKIEEIRTTA